MSHIRKSYVSLRRLRDSGGASIVVRLAMACNDIRLANQCLVAYSRRDKGTEQHLRRGASMYFVRLQVAHLLEGLKVLEEVDANRRLFDLGRLELDSRLDGLLVAFKSQPFRRYVEGTRDKTFHYSDTEVQEAISVRIEKGSALSGFTRSTDPELYRFDIGDDVYDSLLCRIVWKLPAEEDLGPNADKVLDDVRKVAVEFLEFCEDILLLTLEKCVR